MFITSTKIDNNIYKQTTLKCIFYIRDNTDFQKMSCLRELIKLDLCFYFTHKKQNNFWQAISRVDPENPSSFKCFHNSRHTYCWCSILRGLVLVLVPHCYASHFLASCCGHLHSKYCTAKLFQKFVVIHPGSERRSWSSTFDSTPMTNTYPQLLHSLLCEDSKKWVLL